MRTQDAKQITIPELLSALGHEPHKLIKGECWYISPLRKEQDASFKTDQTHKYWYDHGLGKGGNILDFAMAYFQVSNVSDALRQLDSVIGNQSRQPALFSSPASQTSQQQHTQPAKRKEENTETSIFRDITLKPLGNTSLLSYIERRGIDRDIATSYLQEIYYQRSGKRYFAIAFANDSGGYELRNPYYKGNYGGKGITTLPAMPHTSENVMPKEIMLFEGFMDFLSALTHHRVKTPPYPVVVLNGVGQTKAAVVALRHLGAETVHIYVDRDDSGKAVLSTLERELPNAKIIDQSILYRGYIDFNAYLQAEQKRAQRACMTELVR